jgi:hypothetical protein
MDPRKMKREDEMVKGSIVPVLCLFLIALYVGAASAEKLTLEHDPMFTDIEGKWEGTWSSRYQECNGSIAVSFYFDKNAAMTVTYIQGQQVFTSHHISFGEEKIIVVSDVMGDKRRDTCKLSRGSKSELVLHCDYSVHKSGTCQYEGTMTLQRTRNINSNAN